MGSRESEIETVSHDIDFDDFDQRYFQPERPVVGFALRDMGKLKRQLKKKPLDSLKKETAAPA